MKVSLVVSVFNEEDVLPLFWQAVQEVVRTWEGTEVEMVWVNDGSHDQSQIFIRSLLDAPSPERMSHQALEFSRNFGHEAAMIAGIDHATGDAVVCLDSDLQHPPMMLPDMVKAFAEGFDIVTMTRASRADKKHTQRASSWFYRLLNTLSDFHFEENASDFFLISARVAEILRPIFANGTGFCVATSKPSASTKPPSPMTLARAPREKANTSGQGCSIWPTSPSSRFRKPLYAAMAMAVTFFLLTIGVAGYSLVVYFFGDKPPAGYTTLIVFLSLSFTMLFFVLAVLSMYIGRGVEEIQERPIYLIKERPFGGRLQQLKRRTSRHTRPIGI